MAAPYGDLVHEGQLLDPVCRDIEALLLSARRSASRARCIVLLRPGALFIEGVESPYSLMAASKGVYGEAAGEWSADRCARLLQDRGAAAACSIAAPASIAARGVERHEDRRRRQDRLGHAGLRARAGAAPLERHPRRGRRGHRRRGPQQQVHLQHARAHQRPHGQGRQGRHRRRRARSAARAVRLFGTRAELRSSPAMSSRCSTSAA